MVDQNPTQLVDKNSAGFPEPMICYIANWPKFWGTFFLGGAGVFFGGLLAGALIVMAFSGFRYGAFAGVLCMLGTPVVWLTLLPMFAIRRPAFWRASMMHEVWIKSDQIRIDGFHGTQYHYEDLRRIRILHGRMILEFTPPIKPLKIYIDTIQDDVALEQFLLRKRDDVSMKIMRDRDQLFAPDVLMNGSAEALKTEHQTESAWQGPDSAPFTQSQHGRGFSSPQDKHPLDDEMFSLSRSKRVYLIYRLLSVLVYLSPFLLIMFSCIFSDYFGADLVMGIMALFGVAFVWMIRDHVTRNQPRKLIIHEQGLRLIGRKGVVVNAAWWRLEKIKTGPLSLTLMLKCRYASEGLASRDRYDVYKLNWLDHADAQHFSGLIHERMAAAKQDAPRETTL